MHHYYLPLKTIRDLIIRGNYRIDGLTSKDIRSLYSAVDSLPIPHESALFTRGDRLLMRKLSS